MFDILEIKLNNFRSYYGKHVFTFPTEPGLYSLTGLNQENPRLGANDTGKTTLLDGIYWCFYGRTTRGLRASDIVTWGATSCEVTVTAALGGTTHTIRRCQSPNQLTLDGSVVTQETLERTLRLTPIQFLYSVMLPQFGNTFFDLGPTEKLNLFSQILGLDYWLDRSAEADAIAKELENEHWDKKRELLQLETRLETINRDIEDLKGKNGKFKETRKNAVNLLYYHRRKAQGIIDAARLAIGQDQAALAKLQKKLDAIDIKCPTCKQPMLNDELKTLKQNQADFQADITRQLRHLAAAETDVGMRNQQIEEERKRENPYAQIIAEKSLEIGGLKRSIARAVAEIEEINRDHAAVGFWVSGFKRVRLFVVDTVLKQLEIEVNNNLASLGLTDWKVTFDIERENKSGGVTRGFTVYINPPSLQNDAPLKWEVFSGGATQRLRLAGNLGLANLIMERHGLRSSVEFYDEPSAHMSQSGIEDLLTTLHERTLTEGKKIWVVDHHSLDFGDFAGVLKVIKDEKGSRITFSQ